MHLMKLMSSKLIILLDFTSAAIKQRMEKDVDEVKKTAYFLKTKVEELDKEV